MHMYNVMYMNSLSTHYNDVNKELFLLDLQSKCMRGVVHTTVVMHFVWK